MAQSPQGQGEQRQLGRVVAQAWRDEAFKQRLLANPQAALAEHGMTVPEGHEVRVVEATERVHYLVLPPRPGDVSDDQLDQIAGGFMGQDVHIPQ